MSSSSYLSFSLYRPGRCDARQSLDKVINEQLDRHNHTHMKESSLDADKETTDTSIGMKDLFHHVPGATSFPFVGIDDTEQHVTRLTTQTTQDTGRRGRHEGNDQ
eukprot:scaffold1270_cov252-Amphora_coffeaeformis.AAC.1